MKYMIEYSIRMSGLTYEQLFANEQAFLSAFSKWKPDDNLKVLAILGKVSTGGGYILLETDDPKAVLTFLAKFRYWAEANVVPVVDIGDSIAIAHGALAWAKASSKP